MSEEQHQANGVVALLTAADGRVMATACDFDKSGYGGFKLHEAQRIRARDRMRAAYFRAMCPSPVATAINAYHADSIFRELVNNEDYKEQFILVGHESAEPDTYDYVNR